MSNILEKSFNDAYGEVDEFFWNIEQNGTMNINGVEFADRRDQNQFALSVMEAIKDKSILLIEAGVGIGKSFGYLVPIFFTMNNVTTFKQVVISTSTMALQNQLFSDVNKVSNMLGIDVKVVVIKGIHNYACLKKIDSLISGEKDLDKRKQYRKILREMEIKKSADRSDLVDISDDVWENIKADSRGVCSKCAYSTACLYQRHLANIKKMDDENEKFILVTNHAFLAFLLKNNSDILKRTDSFVIDEAHKFEENVRNLNSYSIELKKVNDCIGRIQRTLGDRTTRGLIRKVSDLYSEIANTIERMKKNDSRYDAKRVPFNYNALVKEKLGLVVDGISKYIADANSRCYGNMELMKQLSSSLIELNHYFDLFSDMHKLSCDQKNIYWAESFGKGRISLCYCSKSLNNELSILYDRNRSSSVIFTSGTLGYDKDALEDEKDKTAREIEEMEARRKYNEEQARKKHREEGKSNVVDDNVVDDNVVDDNVVITKSSPKKGFYSLFDYGLGLNGRKRVVETPLKSPYDFDNNSLLYYNPNLLSPKFDSNLGKDIVDSGRYYDYYIKELALEINSLIRLTDGKSLILFTSKEDMKNVYSIINEKYSYPFNLFIQNDNDSSKIRKEFTDDTNSVLFATGTFWEGIDVKGKSLSNLIICRLPFSNLDPILEGKASSYNSDERFEKVYFRDMMIKLKQGVGRLIRSENDTGIVCVLDPRIGGYKNKILEELGLPYTTDFDKLEEFVYDKGIIDEPKGKSR